MTEGVIVLEEEWFWELSARGAEVQGSGCAFFEGRELTCGSLGGFCNWFRSGGDRWGLACISLAVLYDDLKLVSH